MANNAFNDTEIKLFVKTNCTHSAQNESHTAR